MKNTQKHMKSVARNRLNMTYILPVFFVVGLFLLAACGGSGTTNGNGSTTPTATTGSGSTAVTPTVTATATWDSRCACSLGTTDQASKILGGTVQTQPTSITIGTMKANGCGYKSSQGGEASLSMVSAADTTTAHSTFNQLQQSTKTSAGSQYQDVSGLAAADRMCY